MQIETLYRQFCGKNGNREPVSKNAEAANVQPPAKHWTSITNETRRYINPHPYPAEEILDIIIDTPQIAEAAKKVEAHLILDPEGREGLEDYVDIISQISTASFDSRTTQQAVIKSKFHKKYEERTGSKQGWTAILSDEQRDFELAEKSYEIIRNSITDCTRQEETEKAFRITRHLCASISAYQNFVSNTPLHSLTKKPNEEEMQTVH